MNEKIKFPVRCKSCKSGFTLEVDPTERLTTKKGTCPHCGTPFSIQPEKIKEWISQRKKPDEEDPDFSLSESPAAVPKISADEVVVFTKWVTYLHEDPPSLSHWAVQNGPMDQLHRALMDLADAVGPYCSSPSPRRDVDRGDAEPAGGRDSDAVARTLERGFADLTSRFKQFSLEVRGGDPAEEGKGPDLKALTAQLDEMRTLQEERHKATAATLKFLEALLLGKDRDKPKSIPGRLDRNKEAILTAIRDTAAAQTGAVQAVLEGAARAPVELDEGAVAERLLSLLADSERTRVLFGRLAETHFEGRRKALNLILQDLPRLFDGLVQHWAFWDGGQGLNEVEEGARGQVVKVLCELKANLDDWLDRHQIVLVPDPKDPACLYDEGQHQRFETTPTAEVALHGRVARVIEHGYLWGAQRERLRKAYVSVWGPLPAPRNAAALPPGAGPARTAEPPDPTAGPSRQGRTTDHE